MSDLNLAVIGNCSYAALIDQQASVVWACFPRLDGDPVFCKLLNPKGGNAGCGSFDIVLHGLVGSEQRYMHNSAILMTTLRDERGGAIEITDFAPRFKQFDRVFRPTMLVRHVRRIAGEPKISVRVRPLFEYGAQRPTITHGSNHVRYVVDGHTLRLNTDAPPTYVLDEVPFVIEQPLNFMLGPDESMVASVARTARDFFERTREYWREWCRYLSIPFEWQADVIRAAITLKLCSFEETGAIVAALTTSIPEAADSSRNWDYRHCWLRDAYFVVHALNRLGATRTMEDYLYYITNVIAGIDGHDLQPVYGITTLAELPEREVASLAGYRDMAPVRVGNQAYQQVQNDSYGAVIAASTQMFFDRRLERYGSRDLYDRLEQLGHKAIALYDKPDAGLWELRGSRKVHTYSSVMCWVAADRMAKIAATLNVTRRAGSWRRSADSIRTAILEQAWDAKRNCLVASFGGKELDAALLLACELGFLAADDPRYIGTVEEIGRSLKRGDFMFRYGVADDFGMPENAFNVCTFWYIDALAVIGRTDEARSLFETMLQHRSPLGLLSEDMNPTTGEAWGNFPQSYSMVGLIKSAMTLSRSWEHAF